MERCCDCTRSATFDRIGKAGFITVQLVDGTITILRKTNDDMKAIRRVYDNVKKYRVTIHGDYFFLAVLHDDNSYSTELGDFSAESH